MRLDELAIDNCLKCALCNAACPVYGVHAQYPGPKHLGPELERLRCEGISADSTWLEYCLGCHRCDLACPQQVGVSEMIARAKAKHRKPLVRGLRDWWFARPGLLGRLTTILPSLSNFVLSMAPARFLMSKLMRIAPQRSFPSYTRPNLRGTAIGMSGNERPHVLLFPGCFIRYNRPELGRKVIDLLERNGFAAEVAATDCCGVPAMANGDRTQARAVARSNVRRMANQVDAGMRVVTACSSCGHMLKTEFGGLLKDDKDLADAAKRIASRTFDVAELLMMQSDEGTLNTNFQTANLRPRIPRALPSKIAGNRPPVVSLAGSDSRRDHRGYRCRLLRNVRHIRIQAGEVRSLHGDRPATVRSHRRVAAAVCGHRMRHLPDADRTWNHVQGHSSRGDSVAGLRWAAALRRESCI